MNREERDGFMRALATVIKEQVTAATAPLVAEIEELKRRPVAKALEPEQIKAVVVNELRTVNQFDPILIADCLLKSEAEDIIVRIINSKTPAAAAEKGEPGLPGPPGKDADEEAITARVLASIEPMVAKAVSAIPTPRDGRDGLPGLPGAAGAPGLPGKDAEPGRDGVDGLGFDDMTVERSGPRGIVVKFHRGDRVKEFPLSFPVVLDAGVWEEKEYEAGDGTSHSGCFWIAQEKTTEKPGTGKAWRMAVKKGRDGKDGGIGPVGPKGLAGLNGRNFDGTKAY